MILQPTASQTKELEWKLELARNFNLKTILWEAVGFIVLGLESQTYDFVAAASQTKRIGVGTGI